MKNVKEKEVYR